MDREKMRKYWGYQFWNIEEEDKQHPELVEDWGPTPEEVEKRIKEHPPYWIRAYAVNMSYYNPDYMDAGIASDDSHYLSVIKSRLDLNESGFCFDNCGGLNFSKHFEYKYQLILEGESAPWQRIPWMMLGGFVILRQESPQHQWFYEEMEPWVHYVPIARDLSDLFEKIDWLREHDDKAK